MKVIRKVYPFVPLVVALALVATFLCHRFKTNGELEDARIARMNAELSRAEESFTVPKGTLLASTDGEKCRVEVWSTEAIPNPYKVPYADSYSLDGVRVVICPKQPDDPMIRRKIEDGVVYDYQRSGAIERLIDDEPILIPDIFTLTSGDSEIQWAFMLAIPDQSKFEWREEPARVAKL